MIPVLVLVLFEGRPCVIEILSAVAPIILVVFGRVAPVAEFLLGEDELRLLPARSSLEEPSS